MIKCQDDKKWSHYGKCRVDGIYKYFRYLEDIWIFIYLKWCLRPSRSVLTLDSHLTQVCFLSHPRGF